MRLIYTDEAQKNILYIPILYSDDHCISYTCSFCIGLGSDHSLNFHAGTVPSGRGANTGGTDTRPIIFVKDIQ